MGGFQSAIRFLCIFPLFGSVFLWKLGVWDICRFWTGLMLASFMLPNMRNVRSRFRSLISPIVERYDMLERHKQLYTPANTRFMNNSHKIPIFIIFD